MMVGGLVGGGPVLNRRIVLARTPIAVVGTVAAVLLAAPVEHGTAVGVDLLADTAIFVGPTILSTPSPTFAHTAAELFLQPLGFNDATDASTCVIDFGSDTCAAPLQLLSTPALIEQGHSTFVGAAEIVRAVQADLAANPGAYDAEHPLWIFGWSQGATAGSIAMTQLAHDGVDPAALHFVFIGDPSDADGQWPNTHGDADPSSSDDAWMLYGNQTPDNLYPTTTYTVPGDPVADQASNSELGLFYEHMMYLGLTPAEVANHTATTDDMLTSIDISGDFNQFDTWLNAWSHGLLDSGWWDGLFYSAVAGFYNAFGNIEGFFGDWLGLDWGGVEQTLDSWFPAS